MLQAGSLVEDSTRYLGRFLTTPLANPADQFSGPRRAYERFRTKEWVGFTLIHHEMAGSMIIQDAKYLTTGELYIYDRANDTLNQYAAHKLLSKGHLPADLLHSRCTFVASGFRLGYDFTESSVTVFFDAPASDSAPKIVGHLMLDTAHASAPLVVSAALPGGAMYTNKIVYPASGVIVCGDRRYNFDPSRDFAILDEHKSHLPYHADWTWGTFAMPVDAGIVGANFAARPALPDQEEESCLWTPSGARPLRDITFSRDGDSAPWRAVSADGRLDVVFESQGHKDDHLNLGLLSLEYSQWFGHYNGQVSDDGQMWRVENVPGVCEIMHAKL